MQLQKILKNLNLWKGSTNIPMQGFAKIGPHFSCCETVYLVHGG